MPSTHILLIIIVNQRPLVAVNNVKFFAEYDKPSANVAHTFCPIYHIQNVIEWK